MSEFSTGNMQKSTMLLKISNEQTDIGIFFNVSFKIASKHMKCLGVQLTKYVTRSENYKVC